MPDNTNPEAWPLPDLHRARRAIVVVDVVESVRLMQEDEAGFIERWRRFVHAVRAEVLPKFGGRLVKSLGDGMLLEFEATTHAAAACLYMQHRIAKEATWTARLGVHSAVVSIDDFDIFGSGVNLAARVATLALPGEIVVTAEARDELVAGVDADLCDLGECHVKHLAQPLRAFRLGPPSRLVAVPAASNASAVDLLPAIAVVPLQPYQHQPGVTDVLGDVVADEVIAFLSRARHLRVISRLSTRAFTHRHSNARDIGAQLGAVYLLSGSYGATEDRLELHLELADARDGRVLWADRLRTSAAALFAGESEAVQQVALEVSRAVICEEVSRSGRRAMPNQESYTLLMAAVHLMHRNSRADFDRSRGMLDHLIDRHPDEPAPRAWLGKWFGVRAAQGWSGNLADDTRQALAHVDRALLNDPANSLAWSVKGLIHGYIKGDLQQAREAYDKALAANANESLAWLYSATLAAWQDQGDTAANAARTAQRLSPLDPLKYYYDSLSATAFLVAGDHDTSIALAKQSLQLNRSHISPHRTLVIAHSLAGQSALAQASAHTLLALDPAFRVTTFKQRYPGRDSVHADTFCRALAEAGIPE
jgi:adenylate cyclase